MSILIVLNASFSYLHLLGVVSDPGSKVIFRRTDEEPFQVVLRRLHFLITIETVLFLIDLSLVLGKPEDVRLVCRIENCVNADLA